MPYHIDAITLTTIGQGWQDEMALGRTVESICRSLNNLLEHLHQSFFFYLLMQSNRFVSIGTYLPSAMAVAAGFTIMAIHLWIQAGWGQVEAESKKEDNREETKNAAGTERTEHTREEIVDKEPTIADKTQPTAIERNLVLPIAVVAGTHLLGLVPLWLFTTLHEKVCLSSLRLI